MFRIHILEERLNRYDTSKFNIFLLVILVGFIVFVARHKTLAPEKYKAMERKLAADPRLRAE
jgi:hypothetical protein